MPEQDYSPPDPWYQASCPCGYVGRKSYLFSNAQRALYQHILKEHAPRGARIDEVEPPKRWKQFLRQHKGEK